MLFTQDCFLLVSYLSWLLSGRGNLQMMSDLSVIGVVITLLLEKNQKPTDFLCS